MQIIINNEVNLKFCLSFRLEIFDVLHIILTVIITLQLTSECYILMECFLESMPDTRFCFLHNFQTKKAMNVLMSNFTIVKVAIHCFYDPYCQ